MPIVLYELAGRGDFRFSPFSWRSKMALHHKGLEFDTSPVLFSDRSPIAGSGQERIPVLLHDDKWIADSWVIAEYLEATWPDRPSLFGGKQARAHVRFINSWTDTVVNGGIFVLIVRDILDHVDEADIDFFRSTREARLGKTLEEAQAGRDQRVDKFRASLQPLRQTLKIQTYLGGQAPDYADYIVFGSLQWGRNASPFRLLADDDVITTWFSNMLDLFDGMPGKSAGYPV